MGNIGSHSGKNKTNIKTTIKRKSGKLGHRFGS